MVEIQIKREYNDGYPTRGWLQVADLKLATLELPWKDNEQFVSCIPEGSYKAVIYNSPTKGRCLLLQDVPGRTYIEIHVANFAREILGCIAVGEAHRDLPGEGNFMVTNSRRAMTRLLMKVEGKREIWVSISRR